MLERICSECGSKQFHFAGDKFNGDKLRARCLICGHQEDLYFNMMVEDSSDPLVCQIKGCTIEGSHLCDEHEYLLQKEFYN